MLQRCTGPTHHIMGSPRKKVLWKYHAAKSISSNIANSKIKINHNQLFISKKIVQVYLRYETTSSGGQLC